MQRRGRPMVGVLLLIASAACGSDEVSAPDRLTRTVAVPEGEHCRAGGEAHQVGLDRDRDGALDDDEVDETQYQCSTVLTHDAYLHTMAEVAAFAKITEVQGSLTIQNRGADDLVSASLPQLRKVTGHLQVGNDLQLTSVSLPELTEVGGLALGTLNGLYERSVLESVQLPKLAHVHGQLSAYRSSASSLSFPALQAIDGDLWIESSSVLRSFAVPLLRRVAGRVTVYENSQLQLLSLALEEPTLRVLVQRNPALAELSLTIPEAPEVWISDNDVLAKLTLADPGSETRAGKLGTISIRYNSRLTDTTVTAERIGALVYQDLPVAQQLHIVTDRIEGDVTLTDAAGALFLERRRPSASPIVLTGKMQLRGPLSSLHIPSDRLRIEGDLFVEGTGLTELRHVESIGGGLRLSWTTQLAVVDPISFVGGMINIVGASELISVDFIDQPEIFDYVRIGDNEKLERLPFLDSLETIHGKLDLSANPRLKRLVSPLHSVSSLVLDGSFDHVQLDNLTQLSALFLSQSHDLTALSLLGLQTLGYLSLWQNDAMQQLSFPSLQSLSRVYAEGNDSLSSCSLAELCERYSLTGDNCDVRNNGPCD